MTLTTPSPEVAEYLQGVVGVVEANSFEKFALWQINENKLDGVKRSWKAGGHGYGPTVGHLVTEDGTKPVAISILCDVVDGRKLLFYYAMSRFVDHDLPRAWLEQHLPDSAFEGEGRGRLNHVDAMNFCNVFPR